VTLGVLSPPRDCRFKCGDAGKVIEPRLYRAAFLPALLAAIVAMFSLEDRPQGLPQSLAADVLFQGKVALDTVNQTVTTMPDRRAGTIGDQAQANAVAHSFAASGFRTVIDPFHANGKRLVNVVARRAGSSREQIVVVAQRDAATVPDATGSASDTAALLEIARVLQGTPSRKTLVLASVDGGTLGDLGVHRLLDKLPDRDRVEAAVVISNFGAPGRAVPPLIGWSNGSQRVGVGLERTAAASIAQEFGRQPGSSGAVAQTIRLAFPLGIGAQGPLLAAGIDAIRFSGSGELPAPRSKQGVSNIDVDRFGSLGRSALRTVFAIDQDARGLERGPTSYITVARKVLPDWSLALLGFTLMIPAIVASIDAFARARRRHQPVARWLRWVLVAGLPLLVALVLAKLMVWSGIVADPPPSPVPPSVRPMHGGDVVVLGVLAGVAAAVWVLGWRWAFRGRAGRLDPASPGAGAVLALVLTGSVLLVWLVNPVAALVLVPALHLWLIAAIANVPRRGPAPVLLLIGGTLPFAAVILYYLDKLSLGPLRGLWYLFQLVTSGDIGVFACLAACLLVGVFGSLVAILVARARKPPAAREEEPDPMNIFGPGGYAGPGALGGTESALRR
jgi:Peptidase family M28